MVLLAKSFRIKKGPPFGAALFLLSPKFLAISTQIKRVAVEVNKVGDHAISLTTNGPSFSCAQTKQTCVLGIKIVK